MQILGRAPQMVDFKMGSSRVGAQGGIALAEGLRAGEFRTPRPLCDLSTFFYGSHAELISLLLPAKAGGVETEKAIRPI